MKITCKTLLIEKKSYKIDNNQKCTERNKVIRLLSCFIFVSICSINLKKLFSAVVVAIIKSVLANTFLFYHYYYFYYIIQVGFWIN